MPTPAALKNDQDSDVVVLSVKKDELNNVVNSGGDEMEPGLEEKGEAGPCQAQRDQMKERKDQSSLTPTIVEEKVAGGDDV